MTLLIFHNRSAGAGDTTREALVDAFACEGFDVRYSTKYGSDPGDARAASTLVLAGGDGTIRSALERFSDFRGRYAILPLGSANNIATSLGIRGGPRDVARGLRSGGTRRFRAGRLDGCGLDREFVEAVGVGALAASLASDGHGSGSDKIRAGRAALAGRLREAGPIRSSITVDGSELPDDALFAEVLNVGVTGPSLPLAPALDPGAGAFAVAWLPASRRDAFVEALLGDAPLPHEVVEARDVEIAWRDDALRIDDAVPDQAPECRLQIRPADRWVEFVAPSRQQEEKQ